MFSEGSGCVRWQAELKPAWVVVLAFVPVELLLQIRLHLRALGQFMQSSNYTHRSSLML